MDKEKYEILFEKMVELYVKCVRYSVQAQLSVAWAEKEEGWYGWFVSLDRENARKSEVEPITAHVESMEEFDFQACNKTLQYLGDVREIVYNNAGVSTKLRKCLNPYYDQLISIRNRYIGHDNYTPERKAAKPADLDRAVEMLYLVLRNAFPDTKDPENPEGETFLSAFEHLRMDYIHQRKSKAYYLSDHLDPDKYDVSKFFAVCKKLGIDTDIQDDRYIFYTYDLEGTLDILRNFLAANGDGQGRPMTVEKKRPKAKWLPVVCVAGALLAALLLIKFLPSQAPNPGPGESKPQQGSSQQPSENQTEQPAESKPQQSSTNQLNRKEEAAVEAFRHSSKAQQNLCTLYLRVGEKGTPSAASVWGDCEIYSQNTDVAVADGIVVTGVSVGETYIAVESATGTLQIYKVVVG